MFRATYFHHWGRVSGLRFNKFVATSTRLTLFTGIRMQWNKQREWCL